MTEQGTPDARKNTPSKPKSRWLPQPHHPKAPMITHLMRISAVRQSRHHCFSRPPPDNPSRLSQNDHLPTLGECLHIPCTDAVPHFCREPAPAHCCVPKHPTGSQPPASGGPIALTQRLQQQQDSNYSNEAVSWGGDRERDVSTIFPKDFDNNNNN